jgi:predicted metal-dependent hydrolase
VTTFFDALSTFFPVGERFFMASVRAHLRHVKDPRLVADARAFAGQEGIHGREHARYNAMLEQRGYPVPAMERGVTKLLALVNRVTTPRMQLAATCALEHLTALMGHMVLGDPRVLEGAHPVMAALWRWHSAEENEHKSVAYDVYLAAGGTYAERTLVMLAASVIFWAKVLEHQARMMAVDGTLSSMSEWRTLAKFLATDPGALRGVAQLYFRYYQPNFHPSQIDCSELVEAWAADAKGTREYVSAAA